ncbi:T9SS type A sorting domain-containing protein [Segetibacter sp. 3557_3]|uniref:T9SS type A sorting domain-containing protein n=1 Tax=Segetibacter sp. 3557_3 TaxID=2547429 RepID=UPI0014045147|nr:T9SS type A sorting domain-containing protein [Segetibacter sp. 3557_3]
MKKSYEQNFKKAVLIAMLLVNLTALSAQQLAFPGAEGYGKFATGGRGGKVYEVTNLNDDGPGSFRQAFAAFPGQPLTIVFRVSGIINLQSQLKVTRSDFTIAGQTAPGDGICLKGHSFLINGARPASLGGNHGNIIIRHLRSRPGSTLSTGVYGFDMENCHDVIVDHCSFSWANEECAALYDTKNTTVQWCVVSEGLYNAGHSKGLRSYGGVWGGQFTTYHHNLVAHQNSRTVRFNGARAHDTAALIDYRNNVVYNWGSSNACYGGESEINNGYSKVNFVNNYYKPGPATSSTLKFVQASYTAANAKGVGRWYLDGNILDQSPTITSNNFLGLDLNSIPVASRDTAKSAIPFVVAYPLQEQSAQSAYDSVLAGAGATLPRRDPVDARVVNETRTKTASAIGATSGKGGIIDMPSEVGGWPVYNSLPAPIDDDHDGMPDGWELSRGLDPTNPDDRNIVNADGYTMLEHYLNTISPGSTLPLQLVNFSATLSIRGVPAVHLRWATANEVNTSFFSVERSSDSRNFSTVGKVEAKTGISENEYSFSDYHPLTGKSYYRLRMEDKDGSAKFSKVALVNAGTKAVLNLSINPVKDVLAISFAMAANNAMIKVVSQDGKTMRSFKPAITTTQARIDVTSLPAGTYYLVFSNSNEISSRSFLKH